LPLLKQPGQVHPVRVLGALGRIGDASVAPQVLPFLGNKELEVRAEAAKTLASFRYQDAAPAIAGALPKVVPEGGVYHVYAMLAALKELDSRRAGELTRKYIDQPAMKHFRNLLEPLLQE
jgi:HEAT repeat protein